MSLFIDIVTTLTRIARTSSLVSIDPDTSFARRGLTDTRGAARHLALCSFGCIAEDYHNGIAVDV
jgi:hypothetical protein